MKPIIVKRKLWYTSLLIFSGLVMAIFLFYCSYNSVVYYPTDPVYMKYLCLFYALAMIVITSIVAFVLCTKFVLKFEEDKLIYKQNIKLNHSIKYSEIQDCKLSEDEKSVVIILKSKIHVGKDKISILTDYLDKKSSYIINQILNRIDQNPEE